MTTFDFAVWAPLPESVELRIRPVGSAGSGESRIPMERDEEGWWRPAAPLPLDGEGEFDYGYSLDGSDDVLPDPRSQRQPDGVHGWSRTYDATVYPWTDEKWTGRQLAGGVIYEMHIGTFTPEGTLAAAIDKLDHLVELGIDFVELLPVNDFNGTHNWGYDGVHWYAVHEAYGGPEGYQRFVDACHERGLAVIQDVVYNHLGPSGNYLPLFGPYLNAAGVNTWGESPNLDGPESDEVRRYIIDNVLMWLRDFHVDGLRLDAVHALADHRAMHILEEMAVEVDALSAFVGRPLPLIAESDLNDPRLITPREGGGYGLTAQWSDDFHHALYVSLTGDTSGYYADFGSLDALGKVFEAGYFHDGTKSSFRHRSHGHPIDTLRTPTWRLVVCWDNHDQIGNRATGERLSTRLDTDQLGIAAMITLLSPFTPMIFMGDEWGAKTPWQFFTSHPEPELGEAVAKGRLEEFAAMDWDTSNVPNPQDPETFTRSKLDWSEPQTAANASLLALSTELLRIRRSYPDLTDPRFEHGQATADNDGGWLKLERGEVVIVANFSDSPSEVEVEVDGSLETLVSVGQVSTEGGRVQLAAHSAVTALRHTAP
ncbi:MAG: GH13_10 / GH13 / GH13_36 / GH13_9 / GH13_ 11 / GH13_20 [uncultured Friedmanniella sp.]|uniref:Malto-oligosyltrehalose trehalohydrolase n=1 Tax=uncultured Friedmanniella sp. TaxID=335381 RepID=A0A6J4JYQ1_9ACTN|nr:malto-oligosyltrehalose trehalohydrolase [uncultured Friedmanniella sp.]CAA9291130.1 MAG: GH13_10 / GH13 / GH13_36 / GH13_9 / GH13_ 11 / GH13_20 [uncultured Friedmanniella sp.]